jgi:hypothetical protein
MYGSMKKPEMGGPMPKFKVPVMPKPVPDQKMFAGGPGGTMKSDPKLKAIQKRLGK